VALLLAVALPGVPRVVLRVVLRAELREVRLVVLLVVLPATALILGLVLVLATAPETMPVPELTPELAPGLEAGLVLAVTAERMLTPVPVLDQAATPELTPGPAVLASTMEPTLELAPSLTTGLVPALELMPEPATTLTSELALGLVVLGLLMRRALTLVPELVLEQAPGRPQEPTREPVLAPALADWAPSSRPGSGLCWVPEMLKPRHKDMLANWAGLSKHFPLRKML
jgi:hypothetical protein